MRYRIMTAAVTAFAFALALLLAIPDTHFYG